MKYLSPVYSQASGSIAGLTYSRNRGGNYTRARTSPSNPQSALQTAVRSNLIVSSQQWSTLDPEQRDAWAAASSGHPKRNTMGQDIVLSGHQFFVGVNSLRAYAGLAALEEPPANFIRANPYELPLNSMGTDGASISVGNNQLQPAGTVLLAFISRPSSPGSNPMNQPFRFFDSDPWAAAMSLTLNAADPFGLASVGQARAFRFIIVPVDQLPSPPVTVVVTLQAP
jgi:hypothetical protein